MYGKHRGAAKNRGAFLTTVATNVALGRPIVFPVKQVMDIVGATNIANRAGGGDEATSHSRLNLRGVVAVRKEKGTSKPEMTRDPGGKPANTGATWEQV